jgi:hypothetical protein
MKNPIGFDETANTSKIYTDYLDLDVDLIVVDDLIG